METIITLVVAALLVIGSSFTLIAALGLLRLPDIYTKMHAASKAGTLGSGLLLITLGIQSGDTGTLTRSLAGVVFFLLTAPISAHLLAKASYATGYRMSDQTIIDEMPKASGNRPGEE